MHLELVEGAGLPTLETGKACLTARVVLGQALPPSYVTGLNQEDQLSCCSSLAAQLMVQTQTPAAQVSLQREELKATSFTTDFQQYPTTWRIMAKLYTDLFAMQLQWFQKNLWRYIPGFEVFKNQRAKSGA